MTRSLLEQWFPASTVGAESMRDASAAKKPPNSRIHVWWARRPLTSARGAVVASLLPAWPSALEAEQDAASAKVLSGLQAEFKDETAYRAWFLEALGILGDPVAGRAAIKAANATGAKLAGNGYGYGRAFSVSPDDVTIARIHRLAVLRADVAEPPVVLDSFAGGGSIPFEAARYGCTSIANELNPVATAILKGTVDLPAKLGPEFAQAIKHWGGVWSERVTQRLAPFFLKPTGEGVIAYVWAHTVPCPTTGRPTPLAPDFWLARGAAGREVAVSLETDAQRGTVTLDIVEGSEAKRWGTVSTYKRGAAQSIWTQETFSGDYIREMALAGKVGEMLLAVVVTRPGVSGRAFRAPTLDDQAAIDAATQELAKRRPGWEIDDLIPSEAIPAGKETERILNMGLRQWSEMFTPRQLLANVTALEELRAVVAEARTEIGEEQGRALGLYLALALDKAVDYNGMLSSWDATRLKVRNTFDRHDFAYKWSFAEFDGGHSLLPWAVAQIEDAYKGIAKLVYRPDTFLDHERRDAARIIEGTATMLPLADCSVDTVVTDPPYFDNVMYAEVADYFYVWLKRSLRDTWPEYTGLALTDKEGEAVANTSLFKEVGVSAKEARAGKGRTATQLANARYEDLLGQSFAEMHRVLKDDGVATIMFTHKRVDAWDTLGAALLDAGFAIQSSWPVRTEAEHSLHQAKKNSAASTIFLTCTKRTTTTPAYWSNIRAEVEQVAVDAATRFAADGMAGVDLTLATYGPVLGVLSRNWPVYTGLLDADGRPEVLRPDAALNLARQRVGDLKKRVLLGGRSVEFDPITDWWLLAWSDFQAVEFPFDEARKLSMATHLEVADLARVYKVIKQGTGTVSLLTPKQRRTAGDFDPEAHEQPTWLDRLHALMLTYEEMGMIPARSWLASRNLTDDSRLRALIGAALRAIPRVKDKGEFILPEARVLDSMRIALFDDILPPVDPTQLQPAFKQLAIDDAAADDDATASDVVADDNAGEELDVVDG